MLNGTVLTFDSYKIVFTGDGLADLVSLCCEESLLYPARVPYCQYFTAECMLCGGISEIEIQAPGDAVPTTTRWNDRKIFKPWISRLLGDVEVEINDEMC